MIPQLFNYEGKQVRTIIKNGEPWFVTKDVCEVLEITNYRDSITRLSDSMKGVATTDTLGGKQEMSIISEPGVWKIAFTSRKPEAEKFTDWLAEEVIPSIRKTGTYSIQPKDSYMIEDPIARAEAWITEAKERQSLTLQLEEQLPKVNFANALETSKNSILIGELATLLKQNGIEIGQNRLFAKLRNDGYLIKMKGERFNAPTQRSMELGLMEIKKCTINNPDGSVRVTNTPKITGKGQIYFVNKFKGQLIAV
jgi:anti-repressor protein